MSLQKLRKERSVLRASLTKGKSNVDDLVSKEDRVTLNAEYELLTRRFEELCIKDNEIKELLYSDETVSDVELQDEMDKVDHYSRLFYQAKVLVESSNDTHRDNASNYGSVPSNHSDNVSNVAPSYQCKLPELKIKDFDGALSKWLPFWSSFEKIDGDNRLSPSDKLAYLTMAMTAGSPARQLVESYPASSAMYPIVVEALKSRFGRTDLLTEFYIRELLKIILHNMSSSLSISVLYDTLQCHLRNLEVLGVTAENYASILMPLVSSCLPPDLLKIWERSVMIQVDTSKPNASSKDFLQSLMKFLKAEVETGQKLDLAKDAFGLADQHVSVSHGNKYEMRPTASSLVSNTNVYGTAKIVCIFCTGSHNSTDCQKDMSLVERQNVVKKKGACYRCLRMGHHSVKCKIKIKCAKCNGSHAAIICNNEVRKTSGTSNRQKAESNKSTVNIDIVEAQQALASYSKHCQVLMQTLLVNLRGIDGKVKRVRLLFDTGSQKSYVLAKTAEEMGYLPVRQEEIQHSLFGGQVTKATEHNVYKIVLSNLEMTYHCNFEVLGQPKICGQVLTVPDGPWLNDLAERNIVISDVGNNGDIEILVGSDVLGKLWTGKIHHLASGLVTMETLLGWTLCGKLPKMQTSKSGSNSMATVVTNLLVKDGTISDLWSLDVLGITDPTNMITKAEIEQAANKYFLETVQIDANNRYKVKLPWVENHPPLLSNQQIALQRLESTVRKLKKDGYYEDYQSVFDTWEERGVIEQVPLDEISMIKHYLPHRHVIKVNSSTPVRPVFDASAHQFGSPSLNECLEKGPNLIEKIPACLARFREKRVGVSGDIEKAFLQIGLCKEDRNFLGFLWRDKNNQLRTYRHCRVVFGVSPSPFLLEACIKLHLDTTLALCKEKGSDYPIEMVEILKSSFYVDNCLSSLDTEEEAETFMSVASMVMQERQFSLRGWEWSGDNNFTKASNVLGLLWDRSDDTLSINIESLQSMDIESITKKVILSAAHRIFDPIGFICCTSLIPKLLLQETWEQQLTWTQEVSEDIQKRFLQWMKEVPLINQIKVPRWIADSNEPKDKWTIHVFSDACKLSYACAIFLRIEHKDGVSVRLLAARSRVAPSSSAKTKTLTIPRLELLAASIGVRLYNTVVQDFKLDGVSATFWTDASTVLAWIKWNEPWNTFVMNRIKEIRESTECHQWRHVPGEMNPADLPSRGCSPKKLLQSRWWEGPDWLLKPADSWPTTELSDELNLDKEEINRERKKTIVSSMLNTESDMPKDWYYYHFSSYKKTIRTIAWMLRFRFNCTAEESQRKHGELTAEEYKLAEQKVLWFVQRDSFDGISDPKLSSLVPFIDENGLIRLKTKVSNCPDSEDFRYPVVLPNAEHPVVKKLIVEVHKDQCHAGPQILTAVLRQHYWILGGRKTVRSVVHSCQRCKRYLSKRVEVEPIPLPENRVRDAKPFEITGVDFAGPLYIKDDNDSSKKTWVCLFTCAVYRAVRLELVSTLSTNGFIQALRRFTSRQGRPSIIYSDNGSNFTGFDNACANVDWNAVASYSSVRRIEWRFNPPSAPWWGGWWERLIGLTKDLLRRTLGRTSVSFEELQTLLCECESVINSRPLTYLSENASDLTCITPDMFLHNLNEFGLPEYQLMTHGDFNKKLRYSQELRKQICERFRLEYLGQLQLFANNKKKHELTVGEIVLVGDDNTKKINWPLGQIVELISGNDNQVRVAKIRTSNGVLTRPCQRVYPLELQCCPDDETPMKDSSDEVIDDNLDPTLNIDFTEDVVSDIEPEVTVPQNEIEEFHPNDKQISNRVKKEHRFTTPLVPKVAIPHSTRRGRVIQKPSRYSD